MSVVVHGYDVELTLRAKKDKRYIKSKKAMVLHYHSSIEKTLDDAVYKKNRTLAEFDKRTAIRRLKELGIERNG